MSRKALGHLAETLDVIAAGTFEQRDVRLLFADLRQFLKNPLLRDIADYIAHPEGRTKGLSNREIELNFHKVRRVANQSPPLPLSPIDDHLMELWLTGIDRTSASAARSLLGMDRQSARKLVGSSYVHNRNQWHLPDGMSLASVESIWRVLHGVFNALKPDPLFQQDGVIREVSDAVKRLALPRQADYLAAIARTQTDVMVCVLCELQHATLRLRDGTTAVLEWGLLGGTPLLGLYSSFVIPYHRDAPDGTLTIKIHHVASRARAPDYLGVDVAPDFLLRAERLSSGRLSLQVA